MPESVKNIFVSYSSADKDLADKFFLHLKGLDRHFPVDLWIDQDEIRVGDLWQPEIEKALERADLAILLISPAFLASPFISDQELRAFAGDYSDDETNDLRGHLE